MVNVILIFLLILFVVAYWRINDIQRYFWQRKYQQHSLSAQDKEILRRYMPIYRQLSNEEQSRLESHIVWFLGEKRILGKDGLTVNRPMGLIVAADACLLVINQSWPLYPNVKEVLLYPSSYYVPESSRDGAGLVSYHTTIRQGESWPGGTLVLSWHDVLEGNRLPQDGHNLVFHEFAHQLDQQTGQTNGTPLLPKSITYGRWGTVFTRAYQRLKTQIAYHMPHTFHPYGATNEAEFFAVATETFIEKPRQFKHEEPELYHLMVEYFRFDPENWHPTPTF
ncbi:M90 family metallopeptidase [Pseudoalteromonas xiamenensis]|uniref:Zinc-dependent peptidase n=1 Tax=Pseudoalteromonas xiamenensis TaxID=882626 RepID=A0A975DJZ1_9GAMM|nr:M90 family metallopeptidase [Pseudoalteromonas xiamenensis]QTH72934.1 zinc-dependent peptidase [Pseudoalteromonas xiamenensis]